MPAGLSREPCRKVCYAERQPLIPYAWSFNSVPSLSASARSISPSASCANPSRLILGCRSWGDSMGWAGAEGSAVEANRKAWRARGEELGPGVGLGMYAGRAHGRRGYGDQRRTRGEGEGRTWETAGTRRAALFIFVCGDVLAEVKLPPALFALRTQLSTASQRNQTQPRTPPPKPTETRNIPPLATTPRYIIKNFCCPHPSVINPLPIGFKEQIHATLSCDL